MLEEAGSQQERRLHLALDVVFGTTHELLPLKYAMVGPVLSSRFHAPVRDWHSRFHGSRHSSDGMS